MQAAATRSCRQVDGREREWATDSRWKGIRRDYSADEVVRLRGSVRVEYTLARRFELGD